MLFGTENVLHLAMANSDSDMNSFNLSIWATLTRPEHTADLYWKYL